MQKISKRCYNCSGTGAITIVPEPPESPYGESCDVCDGNGLIAFAELGDVTETTHICPTYQIVENTDPSEYQALSDANKQNYRDITGMGTVDLRDGSVVRATLWVLFDAQSTTRADIITMLGE